MILQALDEYYHRMVDAHPGELSAYGFERKSIPVIIELTEAGEVHQILVNDDKKNITEYIVPKGIKKTSGIASNLLWDNAEYVLGYAKKIIDKTTQKHQAFKERLDQLKSDDEGLDAIKRFLTDLDLNVLQSRSDFDQEIFDQSPVVSFKLSNDSGLICERPAVIKAVKERLVENNEGERKICLVTGRITEIERLHPPIKGVWGAQSSGANIVSFNLSAFSSFNKKQGDNSPVGTEAAFHYTESLNYLLRKGSPQRTQVGDASTVFWSEKGNQVIENAFLSLMSNPEKLSQKDDPNKNAKKLKAAVDAFYTGSKLSKEDDQRFYILGLSPNASRISIRFWKNSTVKNLSQHVCQHFEDIRIVHPPKEYPEQPLPRLLSHLCLEYKLSNLPPNLAGEVAQSIIDNQPYPYTLLSAAVRRNKAEQKVTFPRAALIKACLNRQIRHSHFNLKEIAMALDSSNTDIPYVLGRWFATLEKIQEDAHPGINATIKDRYYGAISSNPVSVFSILDRLKNHHLSKLEPKFRIPKERLLGQIIDLLPAQLPRHFSLQEQGCFAIGYYHQRQDFYKPKKSTESE